MSFLKRLYSRKFFIANLVILGIVMGFGLAFIGGGIGATRAALPVAKAESPAAPLPADTASALAQAQAVQNAFRYVSRTLLPSVVELDVVEKAVEKPKAQDGVPFDFFFGPQGDGQNDGTRPFKDEGLGSGVIVKRAGKTIYVLTNHHVAGNAEEITVKLNDEREFKGTLVGSDERKDIALVKFEANDENIQVAALGDSSSMQVGDWAIAVGSPFGLLSSVTTGIVSAIGRPGGPDGNINDFIQTDAAINKGNSGGALANIRGEVIGINTWIASPSGGSVGLGFAIPINNVKGAIEDFINHGEIKYGWLGVNLSALDSDKSNAKELGIEGRKGAFIADVFLGGPADRSGFLPGDFIVSFNGRDVRSQEELVRMVGDVPAGTLVDAAVIRDGKRVALKAKIDARDKKVAATDQNLFPGMDVVSLGSTRIDSAKLPKDVKKGVLVVYVAARSPASTIGVKLGDIVTEVNEKPVETMADFYRLVNDASSRKLTLTVYRDGQTVTTLAYVRK